MIGIKKGQKNIMDYKTAVETWNLLCEDLNENPSPFKSIVVSHGVNPLFANDTVYGVNQKAVDFLRDFADGLENKQTIEAKPQFDSPLHTPSNWPSILVPKENYDNDNFDYYHHGQKLIKYPFNLTTNVFGGAIYHSIYLAKPEQGYYEFFENINWNPSFIKNHKYTYKGKHYSLDPNDGLPPLPEDITKSLYGNNRIILSWRMIKHSYEVKPFRIIISNGLVYNLEDYNE